MTCAAHYGALSPVSHLMVNHQYTNMHIQYTWRDQTMLSLTETLHINSVWLSICSTIEHMTLIMVSLIGMTFT